MPSCPLGTPTNRGEEDSISSVPKGAAGRGTKSSLYENWALPGKLRKVDRDGGQAPLTAGKRSSLSPPDQRTSHIMIPKHLTTISTESRNFINFSLPDLIFSFLKFPPQPLPIWNCLYRNRYEVEARSPSLRGNKRPRRTKPG